MEERNRTRRVLAGGAVVLGLVAGVKAEATPATVYVDKQFDVVSVESR